MESPVAPRASSLSEMARSKQVRPRGRGARARPPDPTRALPLADAAHRRRGDAAEDAEAEAAVGGPRPLFERAALGSASRSPGARYRAGEKALQETPQ